MDGEHFVRKVRQAGGIHPGPAGAGERLPAELDENSLIPGHEMTSSPATEVATRGTLLQGNMHYSVGPQNADGDSLHDHRRFFWGDAGREYVGLRVYAGE
ncbi:hypothetical protein Kisp02_15250 [Kineosporia sp. NBRC 101731]|nr:hypothetical protein Kisp02_15250 [Kineosporia sp. NBRC 101731]